MQAPMWLRPRWRHGPRSAARAAGQRRSSRSARQSAGGLPCRAGCARADSTVPAVSQRRSRRDTPKARAPNSRPLPLLGLQPSVRRKRRAVRSGAGWGPRAALSRLIGRRRAELTGVLYGSCVADAAIGFSRHLVHSRFDEQPGLFDPGGVEIGAISIGSPQTKTPRPNGNARLKRSQLFKTLRRLVAQTMGTIGAPAKRARLTMPTLAIIGRTARPVRCDADALAGFEPLHHPAQRRRAAAPRRPGDRLDAEIGDRIGDDPAVAMRRDQHVHRGKPPPCHREHEHAAVPEGDDEATTLATKLARPVLADHRPAVRRVNKADIQVNDPAQGGAQAGAAQHPTGPARRTFHVSPAATASGMISRSAAN